MTEYISPDTTLDAHRKQIEILRKMSPGRRALISLELSDNIRQNAIAGIKKLHPDFTSAQIKIELLRRLAGEALCRKIVTERGLK